MRRQISREGHELRLKPGGAAVAIVVLATIGTMAFGVAARSACVARTETDGYQWCFTQFTGLYIVESIDGDRLPYLDECTPVFGNPCDEYPVLTMYAMRLTGWVSGDIGDFFYVNAAVMLLCAAVSAYVLAMRVQLRALYFALAPTLVLYGLMNWDLVGVAFMVIAVESFLRDRPKHAGVAIGLSAATKFFPALLLLPLVADLLHRRRGADVLRLSLAAVIPWVVVNGPFAVLAPEGWSRFFRFNGERPPDIDSLWYLVCDRALGDVPCLPTPIVNGASLLVFAAGAVFVWHVKRRREPEFERWTFVFPLLIVFFLANKVYSPQFSLWLLPLVVLLAPDLRLFAAFSVTEVVIFLTRYQVPLEPPILAFQLAVLARDAVLIAWVVAWIRRPSAMSREAAARRGNHVAVPRLERAAPDPPSP